MCSAHFWKRIFEKMHFEKNVTCYIFGDQHLISGWAPQVVKTKKTRSAVVISFQVVSRRDGCSKVHSRRIWYSMFFIQTPILLGSPRWQPVYIFYRGYFLIERPRIYLLSYIFSNPTTHDIFISCFLFLFSNPSICLSHIKLHMF